MDRDLGVRVTEMVDFLGAPRSLLACALWPHTCRDPCPYCLYYRVSNTLSTLGAVVHCIQGCIHTAFVLNMVHKIARLRQPTSPLARPGARVAAMVAVDWPGGRETKEYLGHKKKVHSLAWNCSGEKLASGSVDQSVRSASAAVLQPRLTHLAIVARWRRSILPKCPRCRGAVPTIPDHLPRWQVRLWALDPSGRSTGTELKGHQESVDQLRWDPKQPEVLGTASGDKTVRIWDTRSGKCSNVIETKGETHAASNRTPSRTPAPSPHPNPNHDPNPSRAPAQAKPQL